MKFSEKDGYDTKSKLEHFPGVMANSLNPGSIYLFLDPCLLAVLWKTGWTDFHEIFLKRKARHKKQLARLFHTCLDCFTVSHLGAPVHHGKINQWILIKFSGYVGYDTSNNLEHLGDGRFSPFDTGFLFSIFWVHVCWQHHIHEIVRIWAQEAICYTVSRLSRLFHALQTRLGGGLRSRSASSYI